MLEICAITTPRPTPNAPIVVNPMIPTTRAEPPMVTKDRPPRLRIGARRTTISAWALVMLIYKSMRKLRLKATATLKR